MDRSTRRSRQTDAAVAEPSPLTSASTSAPPPSTGASKRKRDDAATPSNTRSSKRLVAQLEGEDVEEGSSTTTPAAATRVTRSRRSLATPAQPSAKSLGKRRAVSASPPPADQANGSAPRSNKRRKLDTAAETRSYNLRSRKSGLDEAPTPEPSSSKPARKTAFMPKRTSRAKSKVSLGDDYDVFAPAASTSRGAAPMDIDDSTMTDEDDEDTGLVVEGDPDAMGMSDEDDEELDDEDMDEHVAPATAIIDDQDGPAPGSPTDSEVAREDADTAAAIAAAAAAAAAEGDDEGLGSFAASLRAFPNILAGLSTRLKKLLTDLRNRDKSSVRLVALQDLSELLAMSNEETLAGCFSVDSFIKELINILKGPGMDQDAFEEGGVEMMLLACRCLGNLMEALPGSAHNVVHSGGVAVLCAKLLEIQFIDLAEQTLITLEKVSEEMPAHIVREGGLTALLTYLDFFNTNVQRTAVTTAANCCRSISPDSFGMVRDIMPILRNVLSYSDQRVVEQACLAVTRIVESYRHQPEKLDALLSADLLGAVCTLLVPGGGSVIGTATYTQLLRMLGTAARASPEVAISLYDMNLANTLYHLLVGVAAPIVGEEVEGIRHQHDEDDMLVLTNLVHRPKDQVLETLSLVTELLPSLPKDGVFGSRPPSKSGKVRIKREDTSPALDLAAAPVASGSGGPPAAISPLRDAIKAESSPAPGDFSGSPAAFALASNRAAHLVRDREAVNKRRVALLTEGSEERLALVRRYHLLMLPTLVDVYAASVGVQVRTKALLGMSKIVHYCPEVDLRTAVKGVPMASFLGGLLATRDQPTLVTSGLQIVELLLNKLPDTYHVVFRREGVLHEVERLAAAEVLTPPKEKSKKGSKSTDNLVSTAAAAAAAADDAETGETLGTKADMINTAAGISHSPTSNLTRALRHAESLGLDDGLFHLLGGASAGGVPAPAPGPGGMSAPEAAMKDSITLRARYVRDRVFSSDAARAKKANAELDAIKSLATRLDKVKAAKAATAVLKDIAVLFMRDEAPMSSFEMLESGLVDGLLRFTAQANESELPLARRQRLFFKVFATAAAGSTATPLGSLVKRLQESLSRLEEFDVVTALQASADDPRRSNSTTSMLARQLRIRLVSDGADIPRSCSNVTVSIHAIATFQAFNDYLRPRIANAQNESRASTSAPTGAGAGRSGLSGALAAFQNAAAAMSRAGDGRLSSSMGDAMPAPPVAPAAGPSETKNARRRSSRLSAKSSAQATDIPGANTAASTSTSESRDSALDDLDPEDDEGDDCEDESAPTEEGIFEGDFDAPADTATDDRPVNVKVAADGSKVEAATPDGTRVGTPTIPRSGTAASASPVPGSSARPTASPAPRPSYASALKKDESEWHLEFSMGEQDMHLDTTIYGGVHRFEAAQGSAISARTMWTNIYTVRYRKVSGPAASLPQHGTPEPASRDNGGLLAVPDSIVASSKQGHILQLLRVLHTLNAELPVELGVGIGSPITALPEASFINNKLTAKMSRQLEEPMIVASSCLPDWSLDLPQFYSFLFPFSTRYSFLQSTSFGYARLLARWSTTTRQETANNRRDEGLGFLGRLSRQKVRISRHRMLESAVKVFELYAGSRAALEVEYFEEVGTGLGPTLEFYAIVSQEFRRKDLKLWREGDADHSTASAFLHNPLGLFPAPLDEADLTSESAKKCISLFRTLGQFTAQGLMDTRILDLPFNRYFMKLLLDQDAEAAGLAGVRAVDKTLGSSLGRLQSYVDERQSIAEDEALSDQEKADQITQLAVDGASFEDLSLDFTLPGYSLIELKAGGKDVSVDESNVEEYIRLVVDYTLFRGIAHQLRAFREGFSSVFPVRDLRTFTPDELVLLFGNAEEDWTTDTLRETLRADHGLSSDSRAIRFLVEIMSGYTLEERRQFLQFITGSPKLPVGGFAALNPPLTVVRRGSAGEDADSQLPSVMTCASYLKLPDYSSLEIMRERLSLAIREGANSFHLYALAASTLRPST